MPHRGLERADHKAPKTRLTKIKQVATLLSFSLLWKADLGAKSFKGH